MGEAKGLEIHNLIICRSWVKQLASDLDLWKFGSNSTYQLYVDTH